MEINITRFFDAAAPMDYSASVAEIGNNAGADTWRAAMDDAPDYALLITNDQLQAMRDHITGYGAWDAQEIAAFTDQELNALFMQLISSDIRESTYLESRDWTGYENDENECHCIFKNDEDIYYYLGT